MSQKTKIVCTLGPACDSEKAIAALARAGMDVARINFSHGDRPRIERTLKAVRRISRELGVPLGVIGDLPGPKLRLGQVAEGTSLARGDKVSLVSEDVLGNAGVLPLSHPGVLPSLKPGQAVFLDDGKIQLEVVSREGQEARCRVVVGGPISSRKGVAVPKTRLRIRQPTRDDLEWLSFAVRHRLDWVAASFVSSPRDIERLRSAMPQDRRIPIIAKIETRSALDSIAAVIRAADAIMIARGDLGIEIPIASVPLVQKDLIARARAAAKPVITATQMLESMTEQRRPTRAEATDVANAVLDGSDALMLSAETAVGSYPTEAVATMAAIAAAAESAPAYDAVRLKEGAAARRASSTEAIAWGTVEIAERLRAKAIVTFTASGHTARAVSRLRPKAWIVAATTAEAVQRRLALSWGVSPVLVKRARTTDQVLAAASEAAERGGLARRGDTIVITAGIPAGIQGTTNLIKVATVQAVSSGQRADRSSH